MNNNKEIRLADVNFQEDEGKMILEGYAIVFEQETLIGDEEKRLQGSHFKNRIRKHINEGCSIKVQSHGFLLNFS